MHLQQQNTYINPIFAPPTPYLSPPLCLLPNSGVLTLYICNDPLGPIIDVTICNAYSTIPCSMGNCHWLHPERKMSPPPSAAMNRVASQQRVEPTEYLPYYAQVLAGLILCQPCAGSPSGFEFMREMVTSHPEDTLQSTPPRCLVLTVLPSPLLWCSLILGRQKAW